MLQRRRKKYLTWKMRMQTPLTDEDGIVLEENATLECIMRSSPLSVDHNFGFVGGAGGGHISLSDAHFIL